MGTVPWYEIRYGCETWTILKSEQNKLLIFKRKILSKIIGPYQDEGSGILDNVKSEKITDLNNFINSQTYWGKLKKNVSSGIDMHGEMKKPKLNYRL